MKWLLFAAKNIFRNRRRSLITIMIAAVGTAGILVGGGFALFTYESLRESATRESGHLIVGGKDYFNREDETPLQSGLANPASMIRRLEKLPGVRMVLPRTNFSGLISNGDKSAIFVGIGVDPHGEFTVKGPTIQITSGTTLNASLPAGAPFEIMLGTDLARQLKAVPGTGLTLLATTTSGSLNALDVKVCGIVTTGIPEVDKRLVYVATGTAQNLLLSDKVSTLSVYLQETGQTAAVQQQIASRFPDLTIRTWYDQAFYYKAVRQLYNRIFSLLGLVIVVMVLFAVSNTMTMTVVERTREAGALRALGTLPSQIVRVFTLEGALIGLAGSVLGITFALAATLFFLFSNIQMPPPPGRSVGYPLYINFSLLLYLATLTVVVCCSAVTAWYAGRRTASRPIVEALNHV